MSDQSEIELLLIEDNENDRELILRAFEKNKINVKIHTVSDGEEALEFLSSSGRYTGWNTVSGLKVIFLDLKLPKVGGIEVLQRIKNDEKTRRIPVVISTSSHEPNDLKKCYDVGANSYIVKPVDFE